jgi:non-heme chloroperoxidase
MAQVQVSDGVALHVRDAGSGPAVVMLPGYGGPAQSWYLQEAALRDNHRVVSVDRRSHGRSDRPMFGHRMSRHAKDLHDVLDVLELDEVYLVGSSMGANVALAYVDLFGCDRLRGLMLVDQTPKMINEDDWALGFFGLTRETVEQWLHDFPGDLMPFHRIPAPDVLALAADGPEFSIDETRGLLRDHTEADWRDVLPRVSVPLTAVAGRHSPLWPWQSSEWLADAAPHGRLVVLEESGHVPHLEEPEAFNAALVAAVG